MSYLWGFSSQIVLGATTQEGGLFCSLEIGVRRRFRSSDPTPGNVFSYPYNWQHQGPQNYPFCVVA